MLLDNILPVELVDKIYKIRHGLELKEVHNELLRNKIIVNDKLYILKTNIQQEKKSNILYSYYFRKSHSIKYSLRNIYK